MCFFHWCLGFLFQKVLVFLSKSYGFVQRGLVIFGVFPRDCFFFKEICFFFCLRFFFSRGVCFFPQVFFFLNKFSNKKRRCCLFFRGIVFAKSFSFSKIFFRVCFSKFFFQRFFFFQNIFVISTGFFPKGAAFLKYFFFQVCFFSKIFFKDIFASQVPFFFSTFFCFLC